MSLATGTRLGVYEIVSPLGAGGMGEVYRARDTQLKREVALKTLPLGVTGDAERLARFQREAEVLAALNHPNIAQIHGLADGPVSGVSVRALVMELVEGDDLSQRLAPGAGSREPGAGLPIPEVLAIARQVALALDFAHERGIVHRDLKPANIKVTPDGTVKVLDFGLAKAMDQGSGIGDQGSGNSPTLTSPAMTERGMILGTAAYMSPEQAKGKLVDKRSDIWAFGCVLFELITGQRAFDGEDVTDSIVAVMSREPSWQALPAETPAAVRKLLRRCLEKDRTRRLADIRDALFEIDEAIANSEGVEIAVTTLPRVSRRVRAKWMTAGAAIASAVMATFVLTGVLGRGRAAEVPALDLSFLHTEGGGVSTPHVSPDGRKVAYRARRADGMPMIWVRDLASGESRALAGTEDGWRPFWSPDSRHVGYFANAALKRVPADGGPVQLIVSDFERNSPTGADWFGDTVLYSSSDLNPLMTVPAAGGTPAQASTLPGADWSHFWPSFLPDGRRFLFTAKQWTRTAEGSEQGIYLGTLGSRDVRRLLPDLSNAQYAPSGHLVFARDGKPTAVAFDLRDGTVVGEPVTLAGEVAVDPVFYLAGLSVSAGQDVLAIRRSPAELLPRMSARVQLQFVDRQGGTVAVGDPQEYNIFRPHPDGRRVAVTITSSASGTTDIFTLDSQTGIRTPVTAAKGFASWPAWSPDGRLLAYTYQPPGKLDDVHVRDMRTGAVTPLIESADVLEHPLAWSNDGEHLLIYTSTPTGSSLNRWSMRSKSQTAFVTSDVESVAFSPDDRFVAFSSSESGRFETYVTSFPDRRETWPLTSEGGRVISWRADGREILVATLTGHIAAYPVTMGPAGLVAGPPTIVVRDVGSTAHVSAATRDHSRILIRTNPDAAKDRGEIRLLFGWTSRLGAAKR